MSVCEEQLEIACPIRSQIRAANIHAINPTEKGSVPSNICFVAAHILAFLQPFGVISRTNRVNTAHCFVLFAVKADFPCSFSQLFLNVPSLEQKILE